MKQIVLCFGFLAALVAGIDRIGRRDRSSLAGQIQSESYPDIQEVMVPMRDGVRLQTLIVAPEKRDGSFPFTLDRGPYGLPPERQLTGTA